MMFARIAKNKADVKKHPDRLIAFIKRLKPSLLSLEDSSNTQKRNAFVTLPDWLFSVIKSTFPFPRHLVVDSKGGRLGLAKADTVKIAGKTRLAQNAIKLACRYRPYESNPDVQ